MRLAVVIPAYNEEANIELLLESIGRTTVEGIEITPIVVNDCSGDRTAEIVKKTGTELIDLPVNLGIGGAVQTGMVFALENGFDLAVQVDGDGQHPPQEISKLIDKMLSSEADVVIGSRFLKKEGFQSSGMRRLGINYLRFTIKILTGLDITDSTSGFRLYNRRALQLINDYYPDEYPEPEAVIYFHKKGLKIVEAPVLMQSRKGGKTSITFFNSIYYFWKVSLAIIFSYLKS